MKLNINFKNDKLEIKVSKRIPKSLRIKNGWTDWMLSMNDIRDMVIAIDTSTVDTLFKLLTINFKKINFSNMGTMEEYLLSDEKKIVRRTAPGLQRKEYQTIAIFIKNIRFHPDTKTLKT